MNTNAILGKKVSDTIKNIFVCIDKTERTLATLTEAEAEMLLAGQAVTGKEFVLIEPTNDNSVNRTINEEKTDIKTQSTGMSFQILSNGEMTIAGQFLLYANEKWAYQLSGFNKAGNYVNRTNIITSDACSMVFLPATVDGELFQPWEIDEATAVATLDATKLVTALDVDLVFSASFTVSGEVPMRGNLDGAAQVTIDFMPKNAEFRGETASYFSTATVIS